MFVNVSLRNLLLFNSLILTFFNLSKKLVIDCLDKNANKIEIVDKKIDLEIFKDANLFR